MPLYSFCVRFIPLVHLIPQVHYFVGIAALTVKWVEERIFYISQDGLPRLIRFLIPGEADRSDFIWPIGWTLDSKNFDQHALTIAAQVIAEILGEDISPSGNALVVVVHELNGSKFRFKFAGNRSKYPITYQLLVLDGAINAYDRNNDTIGDNFEGDAAKTCLGSLLA
jgi:hypothetical protein